VRSLALVQVWLRVHGYGWVLKRSRDKRKQATLTPISDWHEVNDSRVRWGVNSPQAVEHSSRGGMPRAAMLFYQRKEEPPTATSSL